LFWIKSWFTIYITAKTVALRWYTLQFWLDFVFSASNLFFFQSAWPQCNDLSCNQRRKILSYFSEEAALPQPPSRVLFNLLDILCISYIFIVFTQLFSFNFNTLFLIISVRLICLDCCQSKIWEMIALLDFWLMAVEMNVLMLANLLWLKIWKKTKNKKTKKQKQKKLKTVNVQELKAPPFSLAIIILKKLPFT